MTKKYFILLTHAMAALWSIFLIYSETITQFLVGHGWLFEHEDMPRFRTMFLQSDQERLTEKFLAVTIVIYIFAIFWGLLSKWGRAAGSLAGWRIPKDQAFDFFVFRTLFCLGIAVSVALTGHELPQGAYNPIPILEALGAPLLSQAAFTIVYIALLVSLISAILGLGPKLGLHVSWITYFIYQGTRLGFSKSEFSSYVYHSENLVPLVLLILAFSQHRAIPLRRLLPGRIRLNSHALGLVQLLIAIAYFGAGYCKLITTPFWMDGYTLQAYLVEKYLYRDNFWGLWLAQHFELCVALSVLTLVFELGFFYCIFFPRLRPLFLLMGITFHASIFITMDINFLKVFALAYLSFLPWEQLRDFARNKLTGTKPPDIVEDTGGRSSAFTPEILAPSALIIAMTMCVFLRVEAWPFSDFRVFQNRFELKNVLVYRLAKKGPQDELVWLRSSHLNVSKTTVTQRLEQMVLNQKPLAELIEHVARYVKPEILHDSKAPVFLVARKAHMDPATKEFVFQDRPLGQVSPILPER